jgi:hypothetical protein
LWAVRLDMTWTPVLPAMPAPQGGRSLSISGAELLIHGGALVSQLADEHLELAQILVVGSAQLHIVGTLILQLDLTRRQIPAQFT